MSNQLTSQEGAYGNWTSHGHTYVSSLWRAFCVSANSCVAFLCALFSQRVPQVGLKPWHAFAFSRWHLTSHMCIRTTYKLMWLAYESALRVCAQVLKRDDAGCAGCMHGSTSAYKVYLWPVAWSAGIALAMSMMHRRNLALLLCYSFN